jgi:hypothetical protein
MSTPKMMAIGDSLYNGVRSLSMTNAFAEESAPALVASAFNHPFTTPRYPFPVLFDLEAELRDGFPSLDGLFKRIRDNAGRWADWATGAYDAAGPADPDNIAVAGFAFEDLWKRKPGELRGEIKAKVDALKRSRAGLINKAGDIIDLWFAINTAFVLNPKRETANGRDAESAIDIVARRKPETLLVNIGSNEGLFSLGIAGRLSDSEMADMRRCIPELARELANRLKAINGWNGRIYMNLIGRPRAIANLIPTPYSQPFPDEGYYETYVSALQNTHSITGERMDAYDQLILDINEDIRSQMTTVFGGEANRLVFFDTYQIMTRYDGKHFGRARSLPVTDDPDGQRVNNYPLSIFRNRGGLFGLDNMHLSHTGYAVLANELCRLIAKTEDPHDPIGGIKTWVSRNEAYQRDTLLQDLPDGMVDLKLLTALIGLVVRF